MKKYLVAILFLDLQEFFALLRFVRLARQNYKDEPVSKPEMFLLQVMEFMFSEYKL
jgi:hypothetical protein